MSRPTPSFRTMSARRSTSRNAGSLAAMFSVCAFAKYTTRGGMPRVEIAERNQRWNDALSVEATGTPRQSIDSCAGAGPSMEPPLTRGRFLQELFHAIGGHRVAIRHRVII